MEHIDKSFAIENTLKFYDTMFMNYGFYKVFPEIREELQVYAESIRKASTEEVYTGLGQHFNIPIKTGIGDDYYHLDWEILEPELYNVKPTVISVEDPNIFSDPMYVRQEIMTYYSTAKTLAPIIIARILPINKAIVIDGNHRFHALKREGIKQTQAIILDPDQHISYLLSNQMRTLYKVHHNLFVLWNMFLRPLHNFGYTSNRSLSLKSYYPILNSLTFRRIDNLHMWVYALLGRLRS